MKFKSGDIICSNENDVMTMIHINDFFDEMYSYTYIDSEFTGVAGITYTCYYGAIDNSYMLAFDNLKLTNQTKLCICIISDLVNIGCKCGGN